jgi:hypothetical protein
MNFLGEETQMKERKYAKELTRDYLEYLGITNVTEDAHVFKGEKELTQHETSNGYFNVQLYDPLLRQTVPMEQRTSATGELSLGVHRVVYVWFNRIQPPGLVVDHKDCNKQNNHLSNLRLMTPAENLAKERGRSTKQLKCCLTKPREFYEAKLNNYLELYEKAKQEHDESAVHTLRCNISNARAKLRYYDAHEAEAQAEIKAKEEQVSKRAYKRNRAAQIAQFKAEIRILHDSFIEARDLYGPDDERTRAAKAKWKKGIMISSEWIENHPVVRIKEA